MKNLRSSKRIVITGVTKGLGQVLAQTFIGLGHQVIGCGRSEEAIARMRSGHPSGHFSVVDVAKREDVFSWSERVLNEFGAPDLLINNAGVGGAMVPVCAQPVSAFEHMLAVNVVGVLHVIQAFVPAMVQAGRGVIVNMSSSWGREAANEFPSPEVWVKKAAPFILGLGPADNGKPLTVS